MAGKRYKRPWCRLDREYLAQDTIRELAERFGPVGPLVFLAVILEAGKSPSGGLVESRLSALGSLAFTTPERVRQVVCGAADLGLIADLDYDEERFRGRLTRWADWEAKDPTGADRSADYRARHQESA